MLPQASPRGHPSGASASSSAPSSGHQSGSSSIVNKPARGWLHQDHLFAQDGINYAVRYIGCLEVNTSMKVLDFDTRSAIAKECINRVCETAGLKSVDKRRRIDKKISSMLGERPRMDKAGANVQLTITSLWLKLSDLDTGQAIFVHDMPNISFASGGDTDTLDFVAYVAKDRAGVRSCFVLECGGGLAQDVITTVGQAFELRFKEFLKRTPGQGGGNRPPPLQMGPSSSSSSAPPPVRGASSSTFSRHPTLAPHPPRPEDVEYYNDLPGKKPPQPPHQTGTTKKESTSSNLIDFSTDLSNSSLASGSSTLPSFLPRAFNAPAADNGSSSFPPPTSSALSSSSSSAAHEYVNGDVTSNRKNFTSGGGGANVQGNNSAGSRDPFDMSPFATAPPGGGIPSPKSYRQGLQESLRAQLLKEVWFHGPISRRDAEELLQCDGDFLVRESQGSEGQYVLTGMQSNSKKHLLLVDPEGVVRTKDRTFESVSHLIDYHRDNNLPIISAESALRLVTPVHKGGIRR